MFVLTNCYLYCVISVYHNFNSCTLNTKQAKANCSTSYRACLLSIFVNSSVLYLIKYRCMLYLCKDAAANRLPKKRGRPSVNGVSSAATTMPCTSNILLQKKRGRPGVSSSQPVNKGVSLPASDDQSPKLPKKRGRPSNSQKSESATEIQLTKNCRKSGRNFDICQDKRSIDVTENLLQNTRSSQRVRRKPKSYADEDDSLLRGKHVLNR